MVPKASSPRSAACARALDIVEDPADLGAGEIGVEQQAGLGGEQRFEAICLQLRAQWRGAPVLPDDGVVDRLAGLAVPDQRRLALVGDADGGDAEAVEIPALAMRPLMVATTLCQISSGSCSTQPDCGKCCVNSCCALALIEAGPSNRMAREDVVPWSMAKIVPLMCFLPLDPSALHVDDDAAADLAGDDLVARRR